MERPMTKNDEWYIYIEDRDRKQFALAGPVQGNFVNDWIDVVVQEQEAGRNLSGHEVTREQLLEYRAHAKSKGLSETESVLIVLTPRDRSNDFHGNLPGYAAKADRGKIVKILCKGKCGRGRWAEMNKPYPGKDALRRASMGEYKATCLGCGSIAQDSCNWYR